MTFDEAVNRLIQGLPKYESYFPHHIGNAITYLCDDLRFSNVMRAYNSIRALLSIPGVALNDESKFARCQILVLLGESEAALMSKFYGKKS